MARSVRNAENRAKSKITTNQGKKSFARGRNEYKVKRGYCEDLIETWRKGHSKGGKFTNEENETRYYEMKALQDQSKAGVIPVLTNQEILNRIVPSNNRANMSGRGRKLPGGGSTSRRSANPTFGSDVMTRDQITQLLRQEQQEKELYKKQAEEAQQRAYLAALKADAAAERAEAAHSSIGNFQSLLGQFFTHYNRPNSGPFSASFPQTNPVPVPGLGPALAPNWAHYLQPPIPYSQPLQRPYVSPTPIPAPTTSIPVIDDTFNNCYRPFVNSNSCPGSSSNSQIPENDLNGNYLLMNPHMNQNPQHDLNTHNFENEEGDEESAEEEVEVEDE